MLEQLELRGGLLLALPFITLAQAAIAALCYVLDLVGLVFTSAEEHHLQMAFIAGARRVSAGVGLIGSLVGW